MTIAPLAVTPHRLDPGDCDRAAVWLHDLSAEAPSRGAAPRAWTALGLSLAGVLASPANAAAARRRAEALLDGFANALGETAPSGDALIAALAFAAAGRRADAGTASWIRARAAGENASFRDRLALRLADGSGTGLEAPRWNALERVLLSGRADAVAEIACAAEACGVDGVDEHARPRLAAALAARAFAELRGHRGFALGTALLRVHAAHGGDRIGTEYALAYLFRQQRLDGAFGHLPPRAPEVGDIRRTFHLPRTVLALWTIHDAGARANLLRRVAADAR
jgi:hypothetical protein